MAESFTWDLFGVPVLSLRADGSYLQLDGQHRLKAAVMAGQGETPVLCEVHEGLSPRQEAELFLRLNGGRSAVRVYDKFRARVVAKEPIAIQITATLKEQGLKVVKAQQKKGVCAIQAIEHTFHRGNLAATLQVLTEWADGDPSAYEGPLVKAVSAFLTEYPEVNLKDIANRLQNHAPNKVIAKLRQTIGGMDFKPDEAACIVLRDIYNERRKKSAQLPSLAAKHLKVAS
jgi:hypothetical protein